MHQMPELECRDMWSHFLMRSLRGQAPGCYALEPDSADDTGYLSPRSSSLLARRPKDSVAAAC